MKQETRRYTWMPQAERDNITKYDWIQHRLEARKKENKFKLIDGMELPKAMETTIEHKPETMDV